MRGWYSRPRHDRRLKAGGTLTCLGLGRLTVHRWTCIGACLGVHRGLRVRTAPYGTGLLGFGTTVFDPIMPVRFLSDRAFRWLAARTKPEQAA